MVTGCSVTKKLSSIPTIIWSGGGVPTLAQIAFSSLHNGIAVVLGITFPFTVHVVSIRLKIAATTAPTATTARTAASSTSFMEYISNHRAVTQNDSANNRTPC